MTIPLSAALISALALTAIGLFGAMRGEGPIRGLVALEVLAGGTVLALPAFGRSFAPLRLADPSAPHALALLIAVVAACQASVLLACASPAPVREDPSRRGPESRRKKAEAGEGGKDGESGANREDDESFEDGDPGRPGDGDDDGGGERETLSRAFLCVLGALVGLAVALWASG